jgi:hypothetical protein
MSAHVELFLVILGTVLAREICCYTNTSSSRCVVVGGLLSDMDRYCELKVLVS